MMLRKLTLSLLAVAGLVMAAPVEAQHRGGHHGARTMASGWNHGGGQHVRHGSWNRGGHWQGGNRWRRPAYGYNRGHRGYRGHNRHAWRGGYGGYGRPYRRHRSSVSVWVGSGYGGYGYYPSYGYSNYGYAPAYNYYPSYGYSYAPAYYYDDRPASYSGRSHRHRRGCDHDRDYDGYYD